MAVDFWERGEGGKTAKKKIFGNNQGNITAAEQFPATGSNEEMEKQRKQMGKKGNRIPLEDLKTSVRQSIPSRISAERQQQ